MATKINSDRITVPFIQSFRNGPFRNGRPSRKLTALTAYDYTTALLLDRADIDIILVGDSLGCVIQGHATTIPVTLDEMVYHSRCVSRAVKRALVVGDLPFMSYQSSVERALESAGRLIKEGGVAAVKLEGGIPMARTIEKLVAVDIPVMGHVGLTPQSYHRMGGHKLQGKRRSKSVEVGTRERVLEDARVVEQAGAFALVVEGVPADLAAEITENVAIPTIGIGAGAGCSGQILVVTDLLGMNPDFSPRFVKAYLDGAHVISKAVGEYIREVQSGAFPGPEHTFAPSEQLPAKAHARKLKLV